MFSINKLRHMNGLLQGEQMSSAQDFVSTEEEAKHAPEQPLKYAGSDNDSSVKKSLRGA